MNKTADSAFKDNYKMLSVRQLNKAIDSMEQYRNYYFKKSNADLRPYMDFVKYTDSSWQNVKPASLKKVASLNKLIADSAKMDVFEKSLAVISSVHGGVNLLAEEFATKEKDLTYHQIEWHRKFTLSIACIVLFLIGAPLGSIIRKGGLGTPLIFAVIFFVIFHLFNTFGEKFVKSDEMSPFAGMWLSTGVLIPIGLFLTYKAMRDSQLFNQEFYYRSLSKIKGLIAARRKKHLVQSVDE